MNCVKWTDADKYCQWAGGRLSTEAEWERGARGGCEKFPGQDCRAATTMWPWGNTPPTCGQHAVFKNGGDGCGKGNSWAVGTGSAKGASPYGLYDMAGNLWEWNSDDWDQGEYIQYVGKVAVDPKGVGGGSSRAGRGGSSRGTTSGAMVFARYGAPATAQDFNLGFRCARDAD